MDAQIDLTAAHDARWMPDQAICHVIGEVRPPIRMTAPAWNGDPAPCLEHVRGLIFEPADLFYDDTLWRRWLLKLLTRMGLHTHYHVFFGVWQEEYLARVQRDEVTFSDALAEFLTASGFVSSQLDELLIAANAQRTRMNDEHRLLPGVTRTLIALRSSGLAMGISAESAFPAAEIAGKLARLGLPRDLFRGIVSSLDLRQSKPHEACYRAVLDRIGLSAAETAFVSGRAEHLQAARRLGLTAIAAGSVAADSELLRVERFEQLLDLFPEKTAKRLAC